MSLLGNLVSSTVVRKLVSCLISAGLREAWEALVFLVPDL